MNLQVISKQDLESNDDIKVKAIFSTIQGEGPFAGERAIFVRLWGCNLQCPMCDTDYSGDFISHPNTWLVDSIWELAQPPYIVVLTGGEPFRQDIRPLVWALIDKGYTVQIETNGTLFVDLWDEAPLAVYEQLYIVCSPKTGKLNSYLVPHIDAFKYVLDHRSQNPDDGLPVTALDHPAHPFIARPPPSFTGEVYLQPMDCGLWSPRNNQKNLWAVRDACMKFGYKLCLQLHKIVELP